MQKKIAYILDGREKRITKEETVLQLLPNRNFRFANPFIVLHHIRPAFIAAGATPRIHPHPHRGFSPVTFQLQGTGYHKDNAGNEGLIAPGDVQWMFAGKGLLHSEGPAPVLSEQGGLYELIQIWVNVPMAHKWEEPNYQYASRTDQPPIVQQEGVDLRLVSGTYDHQTGPLQSFTPLIAITGEISEGKRIQLSATPGYWTLLYISQGNIRLNGEEIHAHQLVVFEKDNREILLAAQEDTQVLYLSALPIEEPLSVKDNFVMNTPQEIEDALRDAQNGAFGTLNF